MPSTASSLFGSGPPSTVTLNSSGSTAPPTWLSEYGQGIIANANALAAQPAPVYSGQLTAGASPLEQQSYGALGSLSANTTAPLTTATPYLNSAQSAIGTALNPNASGLAQAAPYLSEANQTFNNPNTVASYMDPYANDVVAANKAATNQFIQNSLIPGVESQAVGSGQIGTYGGASGTEGTNLGLAMAPELTSLNAADLAALNQGFTTGSANFQADTSRQGTLGQVAGILGTQEQGANLQGGSELGALGNTAGTLGLGGGYENLANLNAINAGGQQQQNTQQNADTAAYNQWYNQTMWPYQTESWASSLIPTAVQAGGTSYTASGQQAIPNSVTASPLQQIGSLLGSNGPLSSGGPLTSLYNNMFGNNGTLSATNTGYGGLSNPTQSYGNMNADNAAAAAAQQNVFDNSGIDNINYDSSLNSAGYDLGNMSMPSINYGDSGGTLSNLSDFSASGAPAATAATSAGSDLSGIGDINYDSSGALSNLSSMNMPNINYGDTSGSSMGALGQVGGALGAGMGLYGAATNPQNPVNDINAVSDANKLATAYNSMTAPAGSTAPATGFLSSGTAANVAGIAAGVGALYGLYNTMSTAGDPVVNLQSGVGVSGNNLADTQGLPQGTLETPINPSLGENLDYYGNNGKSATVAGGEIQDALAAINNPSLVSGAPVATPQASGPGESTSNTSVNFLSQPQTYYGAQGQMQDAYNQVGGQSGTGLSYDQFVNALNTDYQSIDNSIGAEFNGTSQNMGALGLAAAMLI